MSNEIKCPNAPESCFCDGRCEGKALDSRAYWADSINQAKRRMREWHQWMKDAGVFHGKRRHK